MTPDTSEGQGRYDGCGHYTDEFSGVTAGLCPDCKEWVAPEPARPDSEDRWVCSNFKPCAPGSNVCDRCGQLEYRHDSEDEGDGEGGELRPCPLCGGEPTLAGGSGWGLYGIECDSDNHTASVSGTDPDEVIAAWNRRTPEPTRPEGDTLPMELETLADVMKRARLHPLKVGHAAGIIREAARRLRQSQGGEGDTHHTQSEGG